MCPVCFPFVAFKFTCSTATSTLYYELNFQVCIYQALRLTLILSSIIKCIKIRIYSGSINIGFPFIPSLPHSQSPNIIIIHPSLFQCKKIISVTPLYIWSRCKIILLVEKYYYQNKIFNVGSYFFLQRA